jgi:hypothetical protein
MLHYFKSPTGWITEAVSNSTLEVLSIMDIIKQPLSLSHCHSLSRLAEGQTENQTIQGNGC